MKLKSKLLLLLLLISIFPLIILSYISYDFSVKIITEQIEQQLLKCSLESDEKINNLLSEEKSKIESLSKNENFLLWVRNYKERKEQVDFLKDIFNINFAHFISTNEGFNNIIYFDNNYNILYSVFHYYSDIPLNKNFISDDLTDEKVFTNIIFSKNNFYKKYFIRPLFVENIPLGFLAFEYDISNLKSTIQTIKLGNLETFKIVILEEDKIITETRQDIKFSGQKLEKFSDDSFEWISDGISDYLLYKTLINDMTSALLVEKNEIMKPVYYLRNTAFLFTLGVVVFSIIISLIFSNNFVKPIEKLTDNATNIAKGNLNEEIFISSNDEVGKLASNFDIMRKTIKQHIEKLDMKVMERTQEITDLLNNAGQGFLTFGNDMIIHKEYSKQCIDFIGKPIEHLNILEILYNDDWEKYKLNPDSFNEDDEILVTKELIDDIFSETVDISVMLTLLPSEILINNLILTIEYVYLKNSNFKDKSKIMLILTDVTDERKLREKAKIEEERNNLIIKVALDKTGFIDFIKDLNENINQAREIIHIQKFDVKKYDELFRLIHTLKGNAPFYNLNRVASVAHEMETLLSDIIRAKKVDSFYIEQLDEKLNQIIAGLDYHLNSISDFLSINDILETGEMIFEVPESKINSLITLINDKLPSHERKILIGKVRDLKKYSIKHILKRYISNAYSLAKRLGKKLNNIKIINADLQIDFIYFKDFFEVYIHILRNAVDHAIEMPSERKKAGKKPEGNITVKLENIIIDNVETLQIVTTDDGKGIDVEKIRKKIVENNIIPEDEMLKLSDKEVIQFIFHTGISSKDSITNISGRGIGMCAVKYVVEKLKGTININTELNKGTEIIISLPVNNEI